jgi:hypothetical protein
MSIYFELTLCICEIDVDALLPLRLSPRSYLVLRLSGRGNYPYFDLHISHYSRQTEIGRSF